MSQTEAIEANAAVEDTAVEETQVGHTGSGVVGAQLDAGGPVAAIPSSWELAGTAAAEEPESDTYTGSVLDVQV